jgi:hypothetical protein
MMATLGDNTQKQKQLNDLVDGLARKLSQLDAMLNIQSDRESFNRWSDEIQGHYNWACNDLVEQALQCVGKLSEIKLN